VSTHPTTLPAYDRTPAATVAPGAPAWFVEATDLAAEVHEVVVDRCPVRFLSWGRGGPTTLLVHGGAAHAQWWAPVAAVLVRSRPGRVAALDLSGHGLSGRRERYDVAVWVREVLAVAAALGPDPVTLVGHSLGGIVAAEAVLADDRHADCLVGVDAPLWRGAPPPEGAMAQRAVRPHRRYPTRTEALDRFRLLPPQDCPHPWFVRHVAWHGLDHDPAGWAWRFDPRIFANGTEDHRIAAFERDLEDIAVPVDMVMGGASYLEPHARAALAEGPGRRVRYLPGAGHHVMLDAPLGLAQALLDATD
jgi:pimeloyl-ACP methyl ester carboxylesterase